jgi:phenylpyruvate tautomerase PptA (4-oxalocrotonate tautomerase family)
MQFPVAFIALAASVLSFASAAPVADASNHQEIDINIRIKECSRRGGDWHWNHGSKSCDRYRHKDNYDYDYDNKHKDRKHHKGNHYIRDASPEATNHEVDIVIIIKECNKRGSDWYWNQHSKSCDRREHHDYNNKHDYDYDYKHKDHKGHKDHKDYKHHKGNNYIRDASPEPTNHEVDITIVIKECNKRGSDWYWNQHSKSCDRRGHHDNKNEIDIIIVIRECNKRGDNWYWNSASKSCDRRQSHGYKNKHNNDYKNKHYIRDVEAEDVEAEEVDA